MRYCTFAKLTLGLLLILALVLALDPRSLRRAADVSALRLVPPNAPGTFEPAFFGMHVHNDPIRRWPDIPIGSLRLWDANLNWQGLEPARGHWDFRRLDEYLDWAASRGVDVLLPLGLTPRWASARPDERGAYGLGTAAEPADLELWRNYVRHVAEHCKDRVMVYEVGNEANLPEFYSGTPAMLVRMVQIAREEIRKVDVTARLVAPSAAGLDHRVGWIVEMLQRGMKDHVDVAALHLYHENQPPEAMIEPVQRMLALKTAAGQGAMPLWNTESGYWLPNPSADWQPEEVRGAVPLELAARFVPRDMLLARALGFERYYWYAWDNQKMGFIDPATGAHRRVADVYAQFIRAFSGTALHACERSLSGLWTCALSREDGTALRAYWVDPDAVRSEHTLPREAARVMVLDGRSTWQPMESGLELGPTVILIETQTP